LREQADKEHKNGCGIETKNMENTEKLLKPADKRQCRGRPTRGQDKMMMLMMYM